MTSIAPINKGMPVLEGKTNLLSGQLLRWLKDIVNKLNRAVVTDENGNVDQDIFVNGEISSLTSCLTSGSQGSDGCLSFKRSSDGATVSDLKINGFDIELSHAGGGAKIRFFLSSGYGEVLRVDNDGQIHMKTGMTIVYDL
jgi:hypothetical protein